MKTTTAFTPAQLASKYEWSMSQNTDFCQTQTLAHWIAIYGEVCVNRLLTEPTYFHWTCRFTLVEEAPAPAPVETPTAQPKTFNVYGGSKRLNYDHMTIARETEKAVLLETTSAEGSHLHMYSISIWLPKSVFLKNQEAEAYGGTNVKLPFWMDVTVNRVKI